MAKDKKEKREERMKKKSMLKVKPEKKFKKKKVVNEAGGVVSIAHESEHSPIVQKEGLKSGKSVKNALTEKKKNKLKEKLKSKLKSSSAANNEERISAKKEEKTVFLGDDLGNLEEPISVKKQKIKKGKKKGEDKTSNKQDTQLKPEKQDVKEKKSKESFQIEEEDAEEISSGDEDCSRGMKKWLMEYKESRPGVEVLQQQIDDFIVAHEAQLEQEKKEREAAAAEGGWTVVVHHKGRKKTTDAESGISVGSVASAAVLDNMSKKKNKELAVDFYRFQKREAQRNEIMMLQEKFEQGKKRIQQLRAARKFRPH